MKLFKCIHERDLLADYAEAFDFVFSEEKFDSYLWDNKNKVQSFTKGLHKLRGWNKHTLQYVPSKEMSFPSMGSWKSLHGPCVYMKRGTSEGRDFLRHLRNGIAHGRNEVYIKDGDLYLELADYRDASCKKQTAYFLIPLSYLIDVWKLYTIRENQWKRKKFIQL